MKPLDCNISVFEHIVSYCDQIKEAIQRFENSYDFFSNETVYRNAAAMCVPQISEHAGKLTDDFRAGNPGAESILYWNN